MMELYEDDSFLSSAPYEDPLSPSEPALPVAFVDERKSNARLPKTNGDRACRIAYLRRLVLDGERHTPKALRPNVGRIERRLCVRRARYALESAWVLSMVLARGCSSERHRVQRHGGVGRNACRNIATVRIVQPHWRDRRLVFGIELLLGQWCRSVE